jgi:putative hydrolase of the HAD superfamily
MYKILEIRKPQNLLFDADDTLWESNIYFERVIEDFLDLLPPNGLARQEMRRRLNSIEHGHLATRGYGSQPFGLNLVDAFGQLSGQPAGDEQLRWIGERVAQIENHEIELLDEVAETLAYLQDHHRLALVTKGSEAEQLRKIQRSGIAGFFSALEVVREKSQSTYLEIVQRHGFDPRRTWMIGNSPRSDINPALAAGLRAILIPHDRTWVLEHEELPTQPDRFHVLDRFSDLKQLF